MKPVFFLTAALLAPLLICAPPVPAQTGAGTPPLSPNTIPPITQDLKLQKSAQPGTLILNKAAYNSGQPVRITFRVTNTSGKTVTYNFGSGQRYDITASNSDGKQVWEWAAGKLFSQNLSTVSVAPGKALTYQAVWNGRDSSSRPLSPGTYTLEAHLTSNNRPAVTGGVVVNTDPDPTNMGLPTRTPAEAGTIRQVLPAPQVSAKTTVVIK